MNPRSPSTPTSTAEAIRSMRKGATSTGPTARLPDAAWGPLGGIRRNALGELAELPYGAFANFVRRHHDPLFGAAGSHPELYARFEAKLAESEWTDDNVRRWLNAQQDARRYLLPQESLLEELIDDLDRDPDDALFDLEDDED